MQEAAEINSDNNLQKRQQYSRAVSCNDRSDQTENTDRRHIHDKTDDFIAHLCQTVKNIVQSLGPITDCSDADTHEQTENDDLQHVGFKHRFHRISRENVNNYLHDRRRGFSRSFNAFTRHIHAGARF